MPSDKATKDAREWLALNPVSPLCMTKADVDSLAALLDSFAAQEREACAKVAEGGRFLHDDAPDARFGKACAAAIRARGVGK